MQNKHKTINQEQPASKAFLPYIPRVTDRIGRLLRKENIRTIYKPTSKIKKCLRSAKDKRDPLSGSGIYRIPGSCGSVYVETTKRSVNTRIKEHKANCRLVKNRQVRYRRIYSDENRPPYQFRRNPSSLATASSYHARLYRDTIEIHKHKDNFNKMEEALKIHKK